MRKIIIIDVISALLLFLFLYTGISKLLEYDKFRDVLSTSPLISSFASIITWLLPLSEIAVALLLFFPRTRFIGLVTSLILLIALTVYLIFMIFFSPTLPCNCGGVLNVLSWKQHIFFNFFFVIIAVMAVYLHAKFGRPHSDAPT